MLPGAMGYAHLPAGHQEAWADAFRNVIGDVYRWVQTGEKPATVCTFADASRICSVIEAMLKSYEFGGVWQDVDEHAATVLEAEQQEVEYVK